MHRARNMSSHAAVILAAIAGLPFSASAQTPTNTWTTAATTSWSVGPWLPAVPQFGGSASTVLQFNNSSGTSYTASNNLGPFTLNGLALNATSSGTIAIANLPGSSLRFVSNGATTPFIQQSGAAATAITAPLRLNGNLTFNGGGAGLLTASGFISGDGSITSSRSSGTLSIAGFNRFSGGANLAAGTVLLNSATGLGTGVITAGNAVLRTTSPTSLSFFNPIVTNSSLGVVSATNGSSIYLRGAISGAGGLRFNSLALTYLTGNNTYTGTTTIEALSASSSTQVYFYTDENLGASSAPIAFSDPTSAAAATLTSLGLGTVNLTHPIEIPGGAAARISAQETAGTLVLKGGVSGGGDLDLGYWANGGVVELAGTNTYTGMTLVSGGTLRFDSDARLGDTSFVVLDGGCIWAKSNWTTNRSVSVDKQISSVPFSGINSDVYDIRLPSLEYGSTGLSNIATFKYGSGNLAIASLVSPAIGVDGGNVTLLDNGTSAFTSTSMSTLQLNRGGTFTLDNSNINLSDRLPDAGTLTLNGGTLAIRGNALSVSSETVGAISVGGSSFNVIDLRTTALPAVNLTASSLVNTVGGGMLFRAPGLGLTSTVKFSTAPTLTGANGAAGTPSVSIIAGAFGEDTLFGLGAGFVTHDANGVRLLSAVEYDSTITSGAATQTNVSLSSAISGINATTTINSLRLLNGSSVSGTGTLNIGAGVILVPAGSGTSIAVDTISGPTSMHIRNNGALAISSKISATTVNFSGNGATTFTGAISGAVNIHEGTLRSGGDNLIADNQTVQINESGTWDLNGKAETVLAVSQQNFATVGGGSYGTLNINGGTLTLAPGGLTSAFSGKIIGSGKIIKTGAGTSIFNGLQNTFTGTIELQQGVLRVNSLGSAVAAHTGLAESRQAADGDSVLACSTFNFNVSGANNAELKLSDVISGYSRPIIVDGNTSGTVKFTTRNNTNISSNITLNRTLQIGAAGGTFSGTISGAGGLTIIHPDFAAFSAAAYKRSPILTLSGTNTYTGSTSVFGGILMVNSDVPSGAPSPLGNSTSAITLGDTSVTLLGSEIAGGTEGITISRPVTTGSGTLPVSITSRSTSGSVTFAGQITASRALTFCSAFDPVSSTASVGSLNVTGKVTGAGVITIGGTDSVSQPRTWSHVIMANSTSDYTAGTTLNAGTLGIGASSSGTTGPLGSGVVTIGVAASDTPVLYAFGAARSVHNDIVFGNSAMFVGSQPLTFTGAVNLGTVDRLLSVEAGASVRFSNVVSGTGSLSKEGPGTLTLGSTNTYSGATSVLDGTLAFDASQTPSSLNISNTGTAVVKAGGNKVLRTASLNLVGNASLDLTDEDAILDYTSTSPLSNTRSQIISGYNNGAWNGAGIRSSLAAASSNPKAGLGYGEASRVLGVSGGVFASGNNVDGTTVLIRYTALGDANLDGVVNSVDFDFFTSGYGTLANALWTDGDFNYDGKVNTLDFNELAGNFGLSLPAPLPGATLGSVVPEPGSVIGFSVVSMAFLRRRRRI